MTSSRGGRRSAAVRWPSEGHWTRPVCGLRVPAPLPAQAGPHPSRGQPQRGAAALPRLLRGQVRPVGPRSSPREKGQGPRPLAVSPRLPRSLPVSAVGGRAPALGACRTAVGWSRPSARLSLRGTGTLGDAGRCPRIGAAQEGLTVRDFSAPRRRWRSSAQAFLSAGLRRLWGRAWRGAAGGPRGPGGGARLLRLSRQEDCPIAGKRALVTILIWWALVDVDVLAVIQVAQSILKRI